MTTFHIARENQGDDLSRALGDAKRYASADAIAALSELAVAAATDNQKATAAVAWAEHAPAARALRACADAGHPLADRLRWLADGLDSNVRFFAATSPQHAHLAPAAPGPVPAPEPAARPVPSLSAPAG